MHVYAGTEVSGMFDSALLCLSEVLTYRVSSSTVVDVVGCSTGDAAAMQCRDGRSFTELDIRICYVAD